MPMFDLEQFSADCHAALKADSSHKTVREVLARAAARALGVGAAEPLGHNIIHSVTNPIPRLTGAIHIYGGDFFAAHRSEWDAETLMEGPMDGKKAVRRFDEANEIYQQFYRPHVS